MKKIRLTEASTKTALEKMMDVEAGIRKENWRACSVAKLKEYYITCLYKQLTVAKNQAEQEIKRRDLHSWLAPRPLTMDNFPVEKAQEVWNERKTYHRLWQAALDCPHFYGDMLRPSEYLLRAWLFAAAMDKPELTPMMDSFKNKMRAEGTYSGLIPVYIDELLKYPDRADKISAAVEQVDYTK